MSTDQKKKKLNIILFFFFFLFKAAEYSVYRIAISKISNLIEKHFELNFNIIQNYKNQKLNVSQIYTKIIFLGKHKSIVSCQDLIGSCREVILP